jgi:cytidine deaminase
MIPILDERLVQAARDFAATRYPRGWAGAAAMYTESGALLTSVYVEAPNPGGSLCCETGAICEAHKRAERVVATVCVGRDDEHHPFEILAPCGLCMERLAFWGPSVQCAVPASDEGRTWRMMTLGELQPHRWDRWQLPPTFDRPDGD